MCSDPYYELRRQNSPYLQSKPLVYIYIYIWKYRLVNILLKRDFTSRYDSKYTLRHKNVIYTIDIPQTFAVERSLTIRCLRI